MKKEYVDNYIGKIVKIQDNSKFYYGIFGIEEDKYRLDAGFESIYFMEAKDIDNIVELKEVEE